MIAKDSASFPYLAVAQHHGVPYADVLAYAELIPSAAPQRPLPWQTDTRLAWERLQAAKTAPAP